MAAGLAKTGATIRTWMNFNWDTTCDPRWALIRFINAADRYCNSIATGPAHPIVSTLRTSRFGSVVRPSSGPTIVDQSAISCAPAGERLRNAARVTVGTSVPTGRGP